MTLHIYQLGPGQRETRPVCVRIAVSEEELFIASPVGWHRVGFLGNETRSREAQRAHYTALGYVFVGEESEGGPVAAGTPS